MEIKSKCNSRPTMDATEVRAIKVLRESGYTIYDDGIVFNSKEEGHSSKIEIIPWKQIRNIIRYTHMHNTIDVLLWRGKESAFLITLKPLPSKDLDEVFDYLAAKFTAALTKK